MVQKVIIIKDGTEQNPIPLNMDSSGNMAVQVKGVRASASNSTAHRSTLTAPDLLGALATAPTAPTLAAGKAATGNLAGTTTYYVAYAIRNGAGVTMSSAIATGASTVAASQAMNVLIPDGVWRVADTEAVYEFFLSTDAAPKHVGSFTRAQVAGGTYALTTAEGTPAAEGAPACAAWSVDIGVVGANAPTTNTVFAQSTAYTVGAISPVVTTGYNNVDLYVDASQTAFTTVAPALTLLPVFLNDKQATNYHVGAPIAISINGGVGQSKRQVYNLTTNGASVIILVASITNVTVNRIDIVPTSVV